MGDNTTLSSQWLWSVDLIYYHNHVVCSVAVLSLSLSTIFTINVCMFQIILTKSFADWKLMTLLKPIYHFICASLDFFRKIFRQFDFVVVLFIVLISTKTAKYLCQIIAQKPWTFHHFFFIFIPEFTKMDLIYPIKRKSSANLVFCLLFHFLVFTHRFQS